MSRPQFATFVLPLHTARAKRKPLRCQRQQTLRYSMSIVQTGALFRQRHAEAQGKWFACNMNRHQSITQHLAWRPKHSPPTQPNKTTCMREQSYHQDHLFLSRYWTDTYIELHESSFSTRNQLSRLPEFQCRPIGSDVVLLNCLDCVKRREDCLTARRSQCRCQRVLEAI